MQFAAYNMRLALPEILPSTLFQEPEVKGLSANPFAIYLAASQLQWYQGLDREGRQARPASRRASRRASRWTWRSSTGSRRPDLRKLEGWRPDIIARRHVLSSGMYRTPARTGHHDSFVYSLPGSCSMQRGSLAGNPLVPKYCNIPLPDLTSQPVSTVMVPQ